MQVKDLQKLLSDKSPYAEVMIAFEPNYEKVYFPKKLMAEVMYGFGEGEDLCIVVGTYNHSTTPAMLEAIEKEKEKKRNEKIQEWREGKSQRYQGSLATAARRIYMNTRKNWLGPTNRTRIEMNKYTLKGHQQRQRIGRTIAPKPKQNTSPAET